MRADIRKFSLKKFRDKLNERDITLAFQGTFSHDVLTLIGLNLKRIPSGKVLSKRLFAVVVEMTQNIHHYSAKTVRSDVHDREVGVGTLAISDTQDNFIISTGNYIFQKDKEVLRKNFEAVNAMDDAMLKEVYSAQRKIPQSDDKLGAGLGLIDIRRKSGRVIEYEFVDAEDEPGYAFVMISVTLVKKLAQ